MGKISRSRFWNLKAPNLHCRNAWQDSKKRFGWFVASMPFLNSRYYGKVWVKSLSCKILMNREQLKVSTLKRKSEVQNWCSQWLNRKCAGKRAHFCQSAPLFFSRDPKQVCHSSVTVTLVWEGVDWKFSISKFSILGKHFRQISLTTSKFRFNFS